MLSISRSWVTRTPSHGDCPHFREIISLNATSIHLPTRKRVERAVRRTLCMLDERVIADRFRDADLLDAVRSQIPIFAPNQQSTYSNVAFELLGVVLERVSGQDYRSYIENEIFKPLDMKKSTLSIP